MIQTPIEKNEKVTKRILVDFIKNLDIEVKTNTKARGNQGVYFKNRIDVSKHLDDVRSVEVLAHEFAHYIHSKIEDNIFKTGGSLEKLFLQEDCKSIEKELLLVTDFVDKNSRLITLKRLKSQVVNDLKVEQKIIQDYYPEFQRSKKFKEFDKYIKRSDAKYLLKYDRVKILSGLFRREKFLSIDSLEKDFTDMPRAFVSYIRLRSMQKRQARISRRINRLTKYYKKPSELFARYVEGFFISKAQIIRLAPKTTELFMPLLEQGHFLELKEFFQISNII